MGAQRITTVQAALDNDTEFRDWITAISGALDSCGLIKTSDTGQITIPATIVRGASGYEIRRFNDAGQATQPLFFKITYSSSSERPFLTIDIGTGSSGAGALTGLIQSGIALIPSNGAPAADTADYFISVGEGYFYIFGPVPSSLRTSYPAYNFWFSIERPMDAAGVIHADEGFAMMWGTNGFDRRIWVPTLGYTAISGTAQSAGEIFPKSLVSWLDDAAGTDIGLMPVQYMVRAKTRWHRHVLGRINRIAYAQSFDADHLGSIRKFMNIEQSWSALWGNNASGLVTAIYMPWA
jgi:hypothetical protein